jgi:hypothetical protein
MMKDLLNSKTYPRLFKNGIMIVLSGFTQVAGQVDDCRCTWVVGRITIWGVESCLHFLYIYIYT